MGTKQGMAHGAFRELAVWHSLALRYSHGKTVYNDVEAAVPLPATVARVQSAAASGLRQIEHSCIFSMTSPMQPAQ